MPSPPLLLPTALAGRLISGLKETYSVSVRGECLGLLALLTDSTHRFKAGRCGRRPAGAAQR